MRDGVVAGVRRLTAPTGDGSSRPPPADAVQPQGPATGMFLASHGYVVSCRTRAAVRLRREFYPFRHEANDGYDTVEWAAGLPYADGRWWACSRVRSVGATQMLAASGRAPAPRGPVPLRHGRGVLRGLGRTRAAHDADGSPNRGHRALVSEHRGAEDVGAESREAMGRAVAGRRTIGSWTADRQEVAPYFRDLGASTKRPTTYWAAVEGVGPLREDERWKRLHMPVGTTSSAARVGRNFIEMQKQAPTVGRRA